MQATGLTAGVSYNYSGPNQAQVDADNQKAIAGGGLIGGFSMADILTDNDKTLTGWKPDGKINQTAIALANYRWSGQVNGEVTPQFVSALKTAISNTGSYPANPASLMQVGAARSGGLSPDTFNALLSIVGTPSPTAA